MPFFPIIDSLKVDNYALYPGKDNDGIDHSFLDGVNVVLGINGLGKTTLLTMMLRLIVGPSTLPGDGRPLGSSKRVVRPSSPTFFSLRVADSAENSSAELNFQLGDATFFVRRKLGSLAIEEASVNSQSIYPRGDESIEDAFRESLCSNGGYCDFFDFLLICERLAFMIDQRTFAVWDPETQSELLRVLFFESDRQSNYLRLFNEVVQLDSNYRNIRAALTSLENREATKSRKARNASASIGDLEKALQQFEVDFGEKAKASTEFHYERRNQRDRLEGIKVSSAEITEKRDGYVEELLEGILPKPSDSMLFVMQTSAGEKTCLACGSENQISLARVLEDIEGGVCPVCGTHHDGSLGEAEIEQLQLNIKECETEIENLESEKRKATEGLKISDNRFRQVRHEAIVLQVKIENTRKDINSARDALGIAGAEKEINEMRARQDQVKDDLEERFLKFKELCEDTTRIIFDDGIGQKIKDRFDAYVASFIPEPCDVSLTFVDRKIGQSAGTVPFPLFKIRMTSGTFKEIASERKTSRDVSESQAILIDLAFRMALIDTASVREKSMLILDTPESSLDTVFMELAGEVVRGLSIEGTRIIASSNLTRERLVPAMFGIPTQSEAELAKTQEDIDLIKERMIPRSEREVRILDLLENGAVGAAYGKYQERYKRARLEEIYPSWEERFDVA